MMDAVRSSGVRKGGGTLMRAMRGTDPGGALARRGFPDTAA